MSRWFRLHDCVLDDPKVQRLAPPLFKTWINLLCMASRHNGVLPAVEDLAFSLRLSEAAMSSQIKALTSAGLIDETDDGTLSPHKWADRQFKSDVSTERVKRFRERSTKQHETVSETPPDTETETDTDTETEKISAPASRGPSPASFFPRFWAVYPLRVGKKAAEAKFIAAVKSGVDPGVIIEGADRYRSSKPDPKFTKHPTTWLNGGCWDDEAMPRAGPAAPRGSAMARMATGEYWDDFDEQFGDVHTGGKGTGPDEPRSGGHAGDLPERAGDDSGGPLLDLQQSGSGWGVAGGAYRSPR